MARTGPLLAALAFVAGVASAQQLWYQQYEAGLEAAEAGTWEAALGHFEAAAALEPQARDRVRTYGREFLFDYDPEFQRARCLLELGRVPEAREALAAAIDAGVTAREEIEALSARLAALEQQTPEPPETGRLRVRSTPPGASVAVDGRPLGTTPVAGVELTASTHRITLTLPGFERWEGGVQIRPREPVLLEVGLIPLGALAGSTPIEARSEPAGALEPGGPLPARGPGSEGGGLGSDGNAAAEALDATSQRAAWESDAASSDNGTAGRPADTGETEGLGGAGSEAAATTGSVPSGGRSVPESSAGDRGGPGTAPGGPSTVAAANVEATRGTLRRWAPAALGSALLVLLAGLALRRRPGGEHHPGQRRSLWRLARRGRRVGGYEVVDVLGRGGMATTYRARRVADGKEVALKIPHESGDPNYPERFLREARLGESLHHPGIVRILDAGEDDGLLYIAMELLPGRTLRETLDEASDPVTIERGLEIARDIAEALDYAHSKGVVHRDLKPENVMLLPAGELRVMDFGVAQIQGQPGLTASRFFFGSPVYAAPEMVTPQQADHRADLYSLGILLFELLEGAPPFFDESVYRLLELHQTAPLPVSGELARPLPPGVLDLMSRLCAKRPADRYGSAQELLVELDRLLYAVAPEALEEA